MKRSNQFDDSSMKFSNFFPIKLEVKSNGRVNIPVKDLKNFNIDEGDLIYVLIPLKDKKQKIETEIEINST